MITPPAPWIGSPMNAPTVSGPSSWIRRSERLGHEAAVLLGRARTAFGVPVGCGHVLESGQRQVRLRVHRRQAQRLAVASVTPW